MANRFEKEFNFVPSDKVYRTLSMLLFAGIVVLFLMAVNASGKSSIEKEKSSLENAIARDIVQCYSIEGRYPPSLEHMKDHYGLTYDESTFFVDYQPIASNLYPDYTVILR